MELLREKYDYVIVDSPPVLAVTDPCTIASRVDSIVMTFRIKKNVKLSAERAREILAAVGGAAYTREQYTGNETQQNNLEAMAHVDVQWFTFGTKETDLDTKLSVLPSLSSWGRVRLELTSTFRREILFKDLFFAVSFFENYDSEPPQESGQAHKNDFGITTSLGWKF